MASLLYSTFADIYQLSRESIHEGSRQIFEHLLDVKELQCHPLSEESPLLDGTGGEALVYTCGAYAFRKIRLDTHADSKKEDKVCTRRWKHSLVIRLTELQYLELKRFRAVLMEAALLRSFRHMNVIAFRGFYRHKGAWCLVSDYHESGNATTFLEASDSETRHAQIPKFVSHSSSIERLVY